ncbi:MAG TPA: hypothetical protein VIL73_10145 [Gaiellaceae bacterium]|jgi:hypothetical protein
MKIKAGFVAAAIALALLGFALAGAVAHGASSHQSGCHSQHTCPSDHHTYVWVSPTGQGWDCVEPGAREYDPSRDTTTIVWDGRTYYCRTAGSVGTTTTLPTTATESTLTSTTSTVTSTTTTTTLDPLVLPDPTITPGVLNPKVRQATIGNTICKSGWTKTIRPPVSYTNALKVQQMVLYGEAGSPSDYEEDHLIPLELGGAPKNPKNLWPEPHSQSKHSDPLETSLKRKVCKGALTLGAARVQIRQYKRTQG